MGQGIIGVIPISFQFKRRSRGDDREKEEFRKHAADGFFDVYNESQVKTYEGGTDTLYTIKPEILLPNFKSFFLEFSGLIRNERALEEENISTKFNADYDKIVASGDVEAFLKHFDGYSECVPQRYSGLDTLYTDIGRCVLVYSGSYKAYLEEWTTLEHMELLLRAAMPHPLAKVMRFGLSG